jgi:hypothetical protein
MISVSRFWIILFAGRLKDPFNFVEHINNSFFKFVFSFVVSIKVYPYNIVLHNIAPPMFSITLLLIIPYMEGNVKNILKFLNYSLAYILDIV